MGSRIPATACPKQTTESKGDRALADPCSLTLIRDRGQSRNPTATSNICVGGPSIMIRAQSTARRLCTALPLGLALHTSVARRLGAVAVWSMTRSWPVIGGLGPQRAIYAVQEVGVLKGLDQIAERSGLQRLRTRVL